MAASGAMTPGRDARRGVQCSTRQHDSALGADRGRRRRADVCDCSASALAPAIVGIRGGVPGGEPHTCAMPKPACASGMQAQADGALITPAGGAVPRPMCATLLRGTPKGSQAAPRVRFGLPGLGSFRARARQPSAAVAPVRPRGAALGAATLHRVEPLHGWIDQVGAWGLLCIHRHHTLFL